MIHTECFKKFPIIETRRLSLRTLMPKDAQSIFEMRTNTRINEFIARPEMDDLKRAEALVSKTINSFKNKRGLGWAGVLKSNQSFIGSCGFNFIDFENNSAEIGGELNVQAWGKMLAFEAVSAIVNFGFNRLNLHRIEAKVQPNNRGAVYLLEKLGFIKEAHFKDFIFYNNAYLDLAVFSKIKP